MNDLNEHKLNLLKHRWTTELGRSVRERLILAFREGDLDWGKQPIGLPFVDDMPYPDDLRGIDLSGLDLTGMSAAYGNLPGVDLYCCKLTRCNFRNARLCGADLRYSDLSGVDLRESALTGANLEDAILTDALLAKC